jgi:hypothetical protein
MLLCASCQQPNPARSGGERPISDGPYDGPPVTVDVLVQRYLDPVEYIAVVEIIAPTGGWEANLDEAYMVEAEDESPATARLYITLQGPGEGEMVTQALVMHHLTFRSTEPFEEAQVHVRLHRRGEALGAYRRAAE